MTFNKKFAAVAVAAALMLGGVGAAQSASAAEIPSSTLTITPTSGNVSDQYFITSIGTSTGAPVGFRQAGATYVYQGGVEMGGISNLRLNGLQPTFGTTGLDGNAAFLDRSVSPGNNYVSNKQLTALTTPLVTGQFELRFYYFESNTSLDRVNAPYVKLDLTYNATTGAWSVYTPAQPAVATSVSLTAGATGSTVTLSAVVKKTSDSTTATAAAGNILFKEGATVVATVPVASGEAITSLASVADGSHAYTAEFVPTDPAAFLGATSAAASVQIGGQVATSTINVTIADAGPAALTLTGVSSSVNLGTAALSGGTLNASGTLNATVTDGRQLDYAAWSLTGQVGNFTAGSKTLDGKYLGWTPVVTGASTSTAGAVVVGGTGNGLGAISPLASGHPTAGEAVTNVSATLLLKAPSSTPAGAYAATLTLTLI